MQQFFLYQVKISNSYNSSVIQINMYDTSKIVIYTIAEIDLKQTEIPRLLQEILKKDLRITPQ